jgi:hypothetical protein
VLRWQRLAGCCLDALVVGCAALRSLLGFMDACTHKSLTTAAALLPACCLRYVPAACCRAVRAQQFIAFTRRDLEARQAKAAALEKQLYPDSTKVWCVCGGGCAEWGVVPSPVAALDDGQWRSNRPGSAVCMPVAALPLRHSQ